jgi:hypothetical protein
MHSQAEPGNEGKALRKVGFMNLLLAGVDLTQIDGVSVLTVQTVLTEIGLDMSKWGYRHKAGHF